MFVLNIIFKSFVYKLECEMLQAISEMSVSVPPSIFYLFI